MAGAAVTWPVCVIFSPLGDTRTPKPRAALGRANSRRKVSAAAILPVTLDPAWRTKRRRRRTAVGREYLWNLFRPVTERLGGWATGLLVGQVMHLAGMLSRGFTVHAFQRFLPRQRQWRTENEDALCALLWQ